MSHHRFDQTLEEALAICRLGATAEEDPGDPCAICRGEICVACEGDAYDCEHDLDQRHGWAVAPMKRVRVEGDLYHGRVPEGAVYVGRAAPGLPRSPFCNPFTVKEHGEDALRLFAAYLDARPELVERARRVLTGHDLACWCHLDQPCHVDEWLRRLAA